MHYKIVYECKACLKITDLPPDKIVCDICGTVMCDDCDDTIQCECGNRVCSDCQSYNHRSEERTCNNHAKWELE